MLVTILKNVPASLKGELSRWLLEMEAGVFLGSPTKRVRDRLWERIQEKRKEGYALQVWTDRTAPQGYRFRSAGENARMLNDFDGVALVTRTVRKRKKERKEGEKTGTARMNGSDRETRGVVDSRAERERIRRDDEF